MALSKTTRTYITILIPYYSTESDFNFPTFFTHQPVRSTVAGSLYQTGYQLGLFFPLNNLELVLAIHTKAISTGFNYLV